MYGEVLHAKEVEFGRVEPEPETEKRVLRERTPFCEHDGRNSDESGGPRTVRQRHSLSTSISTS